MHWRRHVLSLLLTVTILLSSSAVVAFQSPVAATCRRRRAGPPTALPKSSKCEPAERLENNGTATIPNEILNLVKSIVGAGVLSLSSGVAAFGDAPSALIPSSFLIALMGSVSAYTFSMIARVCLWTKATSYADAWEKTVGAQTSWIVASSSAFDCFAGCLTYSMVLADSFKDLLVATGANASRSTTLLVLSSLVLLPLCLIQNLSSLAPFSLVGLMGIAYTTIAIAVRCFGGAYTLPSGHFLQDLALQPTFGSKGAMAALSPKSFILLSILSTAYIAHFNAPKFYRELRNSTMQRFNTVVSVSFGISVALYIAVSAMGFLTFGSTVNGSILNNYSTSDLLISVSRFAVALSVVFSYPLIFNGFREGVLDLLRVEERRRSPALLNKVSLSLLGFTTVIALYVKNIAFVASMAGALLGTPLIFIYPTLMFLAATGSREESTGIVGLNWERRLCKSIATFGLGIVGVGATMALKRL